MSNVIQLHRITQVDRTCCDGECATEKSGGRCPAIHPDVYGTPTTRRFPRSLAEAFPDERASAGSHHKPGLLARLFTFSWSKP